MNTLPRTTFGMEVEINVNRLKEGVFFPDELFCGTHMESNKIIEIQSRVLEFNDEEKAIRFFAFLEDKVYRGDYNQKVGERTVWGESNHLHLNLDGRGYSNAVRIAIMYNPLLSRNGLFRDTITVRANPETIKNYNKLPKFSKYNWATINQPYFERTLEIRLNENPMILPMIIMANSLRQKRYLPEDFPISRYFLNEVEDMKFYKAKFFNYQSFLDLLNHSINYCLQHNAVHYATLQKAFLELLPTTAEEALKNWKNIITQYAKIIKDYYISTFGELSYQPIKFKKQHNISYYGYTALSKTIYENGFSLVKEVDNG